MDVSEWQGQINWDDVKKDGIKFAMIRLGYGSSDGRSCAMDAAFPENIKGALNAGIDAGVYFYGYARSAEAARREAEFVLKALKPYSGMLTYPVAYDLEDRGLLSLGRDVLTEMAYSFCSAIEEGGYYASYYTNLDWRINYLNGGRLSRFDFWLAQWADAPTDSVPFGMWQKSSSGRVSGIDGNVDLDMAFKDYPKLIRDNGLNGFKKGVIHLDITLEELKNIIRDVIEELDPVYKELKDVPDYWQEPAQKLIESGAVNGGDKNNEGDILNLRRETLKAAVIGVRYCDNLIKE